MTDPTLDWLRSEMEDARERVDFAERFPRYANLERMASDLPAALSVLDRIGEDLAHADMDTLFDALDRLEDACGPEVVEVLGALRDVALRREVDGE